MDPVTQYTLTTASYINETVTPPTGAVNLGLAVGLPLVLVAVAAVLGALFFYRRFKVSSANISQPAEVKITDDSVQNVTNPRYIASKVKPPPTQQDPVYENFQGGGPDVTQNNQYITNTTAMHREDSQNEDTYLQCDPQDDAIYNNDPAFFSRSAQTEPSCEDDYIMPDMP